MNSVEFMEKLEYLLQDISAEEKEEAIAYYGDYLEEAGEEHEADAIREFGSPERVAAIIRSDLAGVMENGGSFTESGYEDERFKDPNFQIVTHRHLPENTPEDDRSRAGDGKQEKAHPHTEEPLLMRLLKIGGLVLLLIIGVPLIFGLGSGVISVVVGLAVAAFALLLGAGAIVIAFCIASVVLLVIGAGMLLSQAWWSGIFVLGLGVLFMGIGFLGIAVSTLVYGTFLPFCVRGILGAISRLFHRGGRKAK